MPSDEGIVIPVRLDDAEARRMWEQLQQRFRDTPGPQIPVPKPGAPDDPRGFFDGLKEKLLAYRREETQQARTSRFLAMEFQNVANAAGLSSGALQKVTSLFLGGLGIGLAVNALGMVVGYFRELHEEARKAEEAANKAFDTLRDSATKVAAGEARLRGDETGAARIEAQAALNRLRREEVEVTGELLKKRREFFVNVEDEMSSLGGVQRRRTEINELVARGADIEQRRMLVYQASAKATEEAERREGQLLLERMARRKTEQDAARAEVQRRLALQAEHDRGLRDLLRKQEAEEAQGQLERSRKFYEYLTDRQRLQEAGGNEELAALRKQRDDRLAVVEQGSVYELEIRTEYTEKELALLRRQASQEEALLRHVQVAAGSYAAQSYAAFKRLADLKGKTAADERAQQAALMGGLDMLGAAVQEFTKGSIEAMAKQSAVEGMVNTAKGLAALALSFFPGMQWAAGAATQYFAAAAVDFAVAGLAAGIAGAMGGGGVGAPAGATATGPETFTPGARDAGVRGGGEPVTRNTFIVMGAFMTEAEAARYVARAMEKVERMGLVRETG